MKTRKVSTSERGKSGFHARFRRMAEGLGYFVVHVKGGGRGKMAQDKNLNGIPDFLLLKPGRCVWVEVKGDVGVFSEEQAEWARRLTQAEQTVYLFRPKDYDMAVKILAAKGDHA